MIPGEVSSTLSASYSPLAPALARNRTAITQFRLNSYVVKTGRYNNTLIGLVLPIIDLGEPLIDADDRRQIRAGVVGVSYRGSRHVCVLRSTTGVRLIALRITPLVPVLRLGGSLEFCLFGALPISAWNGIPA
jgi:hypothetical protein